MSNGSTAHGIPTSTLSNFGEGANASTTASDGVNRGVITSTNIMVGGGGGGASPDPQGSGAYSQKQIGKERTFSLNCTSAAEQREKVA